MTGDDELAEADNCCRVSFLRTPEIATIVSQSEGSNSRRAEEQSTWHFPDSFQTDWKIAVREL